MFFEEPLSAEGVKGCLEVGLLNMACFRSSPAVGGVELVTPLWKVLAVPTQRHGTLGNKGEPWCGILIDGPTFR